MCQFNNFAMIRTQQNHSTVFLQLLINKVGTTCSGFHSKPTTRRPHELFSSVKNAARFHSKPHALLDCFSLCSKRVNFNERGKNGRKYMIYIFLSSHWNSAGNDSEPRLFVLGIDCWIMLNEYQWSVFYKAVRRIA